MEGLLPEGLSVAAASLDAGEDPDSFVNRYGVETFRTRLGQARPVLEVYIDLQLGDAGSGAEATARAVEEILARLKLVPDEIERRLYLKDLAVRTGIDANALARKALPSRSAQRPESTPASQLAPPARQAPRLPDRAARAQDLLLQLLLADPATRERAVAEGCAALLSDPDRLAIAEALAVLAQEQDPGSLLDADRLSDQQKAIFSGILIKDVEAVSEDPERIFEDCRRSAGGEILKKRRDELIVEISAAEKEGDFDRRAVLQKELLEVQGRLKLRK